MRHIDSINLYITSLCNLACADCCAETVVKKSITPEEVAEFGKTVGTVNELVITGGEPTLHKHFRDVMEEVLKINYKRLILATNGFRVIEYIDLMDCFDEIRISHYDKDSYAGATINTERIEEIKQAYNGTARIVAQHITMLPSNEHSGACGRGHSHMSSYFQGHIYGCCVAAGMSTGKGVPLTKNCKQDAANAPLPCTDCVFAVPEN